MEDLREDYLNKPGVVKKKLMTVVFHQVLARQHAFFMGVEKEGSLKKDVIALITPDGELQGDYHLLSFGLEAKKLPDNIQYMSAFGDQYYENNKDEWSKNRIPPWENAALVSFVSTETKGKIISRAERGGYNSLEYDGKDDEISLKSLFAGIFGLKASDIFKLS